MPKTPPAPSLAPIWLLAANEFDIDAMATLLDAGACVDWPATQGGHTALMHACNQGNLAALDFLLARGADPNARSPFGQLPMRFASVAGRCLANIVDPHRFSQGHLFAQALLEAGATSHAARAAYAQAPNEGALRLAALLGRAQTCMLLLEHGWEFEIALDDRVLADAIRAASGPQAFEAIAASPYAKLAPQASLDNALFAAVSLGYLSHAKTARRLGADVLALDADGAGLVVLSALAGNIECLRWADDAGCPPTPITNRGRGPIASAILGASIECIAFVFDQISTGFWPLDANDLRKAREDIANPSLFDSEQQWKLPSISSMLDAFEQAIILGSILHEPAPRSAPTMRI